MYSVQCQELRINHPTPLLVVTIPYGCWFLWRANYIQDFKWCLHFQFGVAVEHTQRKCFGIFGPYCLREEAGVGTRAGPNRYQSRLWYEQGSKWRANLLPTIWFQRCGACLMSLLYMIWELWQWYILGFLEVEADLLLRSETKMKSKHRMSHYFLFFMFWTQRESLSPGVTNLHRFDES